MMTAKVSGTSTSAPGCPSSRKRSAKSADTAAATIPRGPIQAISAFSCHLSPLPQVDAHTLSGWATNWIAMKTSTTPLPTSASCATSRRAARTMKSTEMRRMVSVSLNERMSSRGTPFMLARRMPITVTANNPASWASRLEAVKTPTTKASTMTLSR